MDPDIVIPKGDSDYFAINSDVIDDSGTVTPLNFAGGKILFAVKKKETDPDSLAVIGVKSSGTLPTSGTGTISSSGVTVTGVGTSFLTQLSSGDTITSDGETRTVDTITSNTVLTTTVAFTGLSADTFTLGTYTYILNLTKTETNIFPAKYTYTIRFVDAAGESTCLIENANFIITGTSLDQNT
jgi:hypothetical protein